MSNSYAFATGITPRAGKYIRPIRAQYDRIPLCRIPYSERASMPGVISVPLSSKVFTKAMREGFHDNRISWDSALTIFRMLKSQLILSSWLPMTITLNYVTVWSMHAIKYSAHKSQFNSISEIFNFICKVRFTVK